MNFCTWRLVIIWIGGMLRCHRGIAIWSWLAQNIFGGSLFSIRLISSFFGSATILVTGLIAKELFKRIEDTPAEGSFAMVIIGLSGLVSGAFLRTSMMFQPVVFDVFYWTVLIYFFLKYINTKEGKWLLFFWDSHRHFTIK